MGIPQSPCTWPCHNLNFWTQQAPCSSPASPFHFQGSELFGFCRSREQWVPARHRGHVSALSSAGNHDCTTEHLLCISHSKRGFVVHNLTERNGANQALPQTTCSPIQ